MTPGQIIEALGLTAHPEEGGYYRETYRSGESVRADALPGRYGSARCLGTAIYYLLTPDTVSALHRVRSDEVYHFYLGGPVRMLQIPENGPPRTLVLGPGIGAGQVLQTVVPRGVWQGSHLLEGAQFALMGATVSPGFEFADYEGASGLESWVARYPDFRETLERLVPR